MSIHSNTLTIQIYGNINKNRFVEYSIKQREKDYKTWENLHKTFEIVNTNTSTSFVVKMIKRMHVWYAFYV